MQVKVSKEATAEVKAVQAWYEKAQPGLGFELYVSFAHALQLLREPNPPLTPVLGELADLGVRKLLLHKFPYMLIVYQFENEILILAFSHQSREPGYWKDRIG